MTIPQPNNASENPFNNPFDNPFEHLFEQDFAELVDELSAEGLQADSLCDLPSLANLFETPDLFSEFNPDLLTPHGNNVSPLLSDAEINAFFDESEADKKTEAVLSLDWQDLAPSNLLFPKEALSFSPDSLSEDLSLWLSQEAGLLQNKGELPAVAAMCLRDCTHAENLEDLSQLEDVSRLKTSLSPEDVLSHRELALSAIAPAWIEPWDNLAQLIDQPAAGDCPVPISDHLFSGLEALIEASPLKDPLELSPNPKIFDAGFQDLESLLEEANRTLGGTSTPTQVGDVRRASRSVSPRSRSQKIKIFEQTMRVPVKQLDNVNNLIGELVVKRNRLEQDQDRLRQFLDNLLTQIQNLSDVGGRMQDLHERTLLEGALLATSSPKQAFPVVHTPQLIPGSDANLAPHAQNEEGLDALEMDRFTGFHLLSQEMIELMVRVRESASDIQFLVDETEQVSRSLRQVTDQLQDGMTQSRMVPFTQAADRLPRAIRDISLRLHKQVKLNVEGKEVLIDKVILEHLYNPMTHLVNNAITHGIESPQIRQQQGKDPIGRITIRTFLQGNQTVITVSDDGAGIDTERVKAKAQEQGLITSAESTIYSQQEIYELLFHPGFSTKDKVDDFSGRGVGLDVVRTSLIDIRGLVTIDSVVGQGTTFTIRLPLTLSICQALCCLSNHARIAFPMDGVEDMKDYLVSDLLHNADNQRCIRWNNVLLPIYPLKDLLIYHHPMHRGMVYGSKLKPDTISVVILQGAGNVLAVQVDQVIGEEEIVIKQIEGPIPKPMGIAGTTVQGDGRIMPIADVLELIELAQGRIRIDNGAIFWQKTLIQTEKENYNPELTVLIVDDSITVRELLSLRFNKAGYRVEQARDGQEAWEKLRSGLPCHIVFCDIEMPRMNGLELLSNLKKDKRLSLIPFALLTSRGDESHRNLAGKLGASGYFTKPYTEKDLLDAAQRMIRGEVLLAGSSRVSRYHPVNSPKTLARFQDSALLAKTKAEAFVLIVDDSVMVREMLSMTFTKAGYRIEQARDGQEAWEKLQGLLTCDLILCDIEMPRLNGLELLSRLQEDERFSHIPMAMLTSRGAQKMQRIAAERGAKGYFVKPYLEDILLASAQRLMAGEVLLDINSLGES